MTLQHSRGKTQPVGNPPACLGLKGLFLKANFENFLSDHQEYFTNYNQQHEQENVWRQGPDIHQLITTLAIVAYNLAILL